MILLEQADHLIVIRQTDHALLSGFLAREWGNEVFARPQLFESFCLAAREHDNGWAEWELTPQLDPKTRLPYTFMSIPTEDHIALYQRGIQRVVQADPYAGLLVILHCAGLYDRTRATLPGFSAKYVKASESRLVNEAFDRLKLQQMRLKSYLRKNPATATLAGEGSLDRTARLLETLDRLSLYFCLRSCEDTTIEAVPADDSGSEIDCELHQEESNVVSLAPYPFRRDPLQISILARRVPRRVYGNEADFQKTLAGAAYFAINFTMRAGNAALGQRRTAVA
jgi:Protein of unknown function (DUF3891)